GKSVRESQLGMIFNGLVKVPMQFFILLTGVLVFVFYQFNASPLNFNPVATEMGNQVESYQNLQQELEANQLRKKETSFAFVNAKTDEDKQAIKKKLQTYNQKEQELRE